MIRAPRKPKDPLERFWKKVEKTATCWLWTAASNGTGQAVFYDGTRVRSGAHFVYEILVGPITDGWQLYRRCGQARCVRPDHLEPMSPGDLVRAVNLARTHCKYGHELTPENTMVLKSGVRRCRMCDRRRSSRHARFRSEAYQKDQGRYERIERLLLFKRDGWICHLCSEAIDPNCRFPDSLSASVDHIVPLSMGGTHTYDNVAASHLGCNARKRAGRGV